MKAKWFVVCTVFLVCAVAVDTSATHLSIGFKGEMGFTGLYGRNAYGAKSVSPDYNPRKQTTIGFLGGPAAGVRFNKLLGMDIDLLYSMKGQQYYDYKDASQGETTRFIQSLHYLELPIVINLRFPSSLPTKPYICIGPSFGLLLSANNIISYENSEQVVDIQDSIRKFDMGITFGGGAEVPLRTGAVIFDARYTLGLVSLDNATGADIKNTVFAIMLGYRLNLKTKVPKH